MWNNKQSRNQNTNKNIIINNRDHSLTKNNFINPTHPNILLNSKTLNTIKWIKMNKKNMGNKRITKNKRNQNTKKPNTILNKMLSLKKILIYLPSINWRHNSHWREITNWATNNNGKRITKSKIISFSLY